MQLLRKRKIKDQTQNIPPPALPAAPDQQVLPQEPAGVGTQQTSITATALGNMDIDKDKTN